MRHSFFLLFFLPYVATAQNDLLSEELNDFITNEMAIQNIPGFAACIVKGDEVVWETALEMANLDTNTPVSLDTEFTLASISKLFTATACMMLAQEGALDLDADINDYLSLQVLNPNFPNTIITTRQLLTHKSSLHDFESDLQLWDEIGDPTIDLPTFCAQYFVAGGSLYDADNWGNTAPSNSSYWYSNAGFTLLGYIVEEASGMPFNKYVESRILAPLGMNEAGWFYSEVGESNIAMPYNSNGQAYGYYSFPEYPAGMLKANIQELAQFLILYTQKGYYNSELLSTSSFESLVPNSMTNGFGWWGTDTWWGDSEGNYWSHGGFMNGVRTQLNYYPLDSTGLIILTNGEGNYSNIQNEIASYIPLFEKGTVSAGTTVTISQKVMLFPNPAQNTLNIELSKGLILESFEIFTSFGTSLLKQNTLDQKIDLSSIPKGYYWIQINQQITLPFTKT